ncbi:MAG TPA: hypothetical protein VLK32_03240 [Bacillota bacterium]|nr:hypothetical protein [Bacillota bacterium]
MNFTTHALAGAALGVHVGAPAAAVAIGLTSHLVLDIIPHHDVTDWRGVLLDVSVGATAFYLLRSCLAAAGWWGALAATAPDLEVALRHFGLWRGRCGFPTHNGYHLHGRWSPIPGTLIQLPFGLASLAFILVR